jgi:hypothetical protein
MFPSADSGVTPRRRSDPPAGISAVAQIDPDLVEWDYGKRL